MSYEKFKPYTSKSMRNFKHEGFGLFPESFFKAKKNPQLFQTNGDNDKR